MCVLPCCLFTFSPLQAQPESTKLTPGRTPDGVVYFLPKTVVRFNPLIEKKTYQPGQFAKYADKYLHYANVEQSRQTTHSIADYSITTIGVRDTSKCFSVRLKGGKCETAELALSDDGVLQAVNASPATPIARPPFRSAPKPKAVDPKKFLNADVLAASNTQKQAELTVAQIMELQEKRQMLITGEADEMPDDEQQLQAMLREIESERDALLSMFIGTVTRDTTEYTVEVCPDRPVERQVVFRLSTKRGLVDKDDLSGIPFYMTVEDVDHAEYPTPDNKKHEGFYVNKPGVGRITLFQDNLQLAVFKLPLAQFGFVELTDAAIFKRHVTHMRLSPATGAIDFLRADSDK